jgi:putative (di)nucleoside polyphosphate hydrolase
MIKGMDNEQVIDDEGFRANVGIILCNQDGRLLWARRVGQDAWQFPQGGVLPDESPEEALYRELWEEVGLRREQVTLLGRTQDWLYYRLPKHLIRHRQLPLCIGQKQRWFLLRLQADDTSVCLDHSERPEFDQWCWVDYWHPVKEVVSFKQEVYQTALSELEYLIQKYVLVKANS